MSKDSGERPAVLQHVSLNVRRLRHAAGLSQTALAERSGVSRRMLVAIEAGERNVSLATLDRVAEALGVAFSELIHAPDAGDFSRINEVAWAGARVGSQAVLLSRATARREVELWEITLAPGDVYASEADPEGWSQQVYVIAGRLCVELPAACHEVPTAGFLMFASDCSHRYRNAGDEPVRFVRNVVL